LSTLVHEVNAEIQNAIFSGNDPSRITALITEYAMTGEFFLARENGWNENEQNTK